MASRGRRIPPKGTSYAAEVIATITGESHPTRSVTATTFNVCETESQISDHADAGGSDCGKQPFDSSGTFTATHPTFADVTYKAFEGPRQVYEFDLGTIDEASPDTTPGGRDPLVNLDAALLSIPEWNSLRNLPPSYESVPAEFKVDELKRLLRKPSITVYRRTNGSHDCGQPPNHISETQCKVEWNYQFRIRVTRHLLYRTRAVYAR